MRPYIIPFAIYIILSIIGSSFQNGVYYFYPIKTIIVGISLFYFRKSYKELYTTVKTKSVLGAVLVGIVVFVIWILPEGFYPVLGNSEFNPLIFQNKTSVFFLISFRLLGAVLIVPVFEELFWRSFLIRWIINQNFRKVPIGKFTWLSFGLTVLFFGLEHNRWLAGMAAGIIYNGLYYKEKNLWPCITAHAVTNLALGIYVLIRQQWNFW